MDKAAERRRAGRRRLALEEATPPCGSGRPKLAVILRGGAARTLQYERSRYSRVSLRVPQSAPRGVCGSGSWPRDIIPVPKAVGG
ncbi:hypothetical protein HPB50_002124 [Hyalomma asiaticum]|uniref:Uncharacterized protein n=1 Tax=Hyalomma asiaticum TaxID=266040 RepID=A0ACB7TB41_HYAAI|nr:hypothetical protein HPB50_002124 [Hyalomma asiaticum]